MDADRTPTHLFHITAATPQLTATGDRAWDTAIARWLRLDALQRADADFGASAKNEREEEHNRANVEATYGPDWRSIPEAAAKRKAEFAVALEAEEERLQRFLNPMWASAIALALTPAPNLAAALFKVELIRREELDNDVSMPRDPIEIVIEDMERLAAGQG